MLPRREPGGKDGHAGAPWGAETGGDASRLWWFELIRQVAN